MKIDTTTLGSLRAKTEVMNAKQISSYVDAAIDDAIATLQERCTTFGVLPLDNDINAGTPVSADILLGNLALEYPISAETLPVKMHACKTQILELYTYKQKEECDIVIDWGDGTRLNVKSAEVLTKPGYDIVDYCVENGLMTREDAEAKVPPPIDKIGELGEFNLLKFGRKESRDYTQLAIVHTYKEGCSSFNDMRIVKVYGNDYFMIRGGIYYSFSEESAKYTGNAWAWNNDWNYKFNLICDVLSKRSFFNKCFRNSSSMCSKSDRMIVLDVPYLSQFSVTNSSGMFSDCKNLLYANVVGNKNGLFESIIYTAGSMFSGCTNLMYSTIPVPMASTAGSGATQFYKGCGRLSVDINDLIPKGGFLNECISMKEVFNGCSSLYSTTSDQWKMTTFKDGNIIWTDTANAFANCSDALRSQIPISWGGLVDDDDLQETIQVGEKYLVIKNGKFFVVSPAEWNTYILYDLNVPSDDFVYRIRNIKRCTSQLTQIDWGDGTVGMYNANGEIQHVYAHAGQYEVKINDTLSEITFGSSGSYGDVTKIPEQYRASCKALNGRMQMFTGNDFAINPGQFFYTDISSFELCDDTKVVISAGGGQFYGCNRMAYCDQPVASALMNYQYANCSSLQQLNLPAGISAINNYALRNCLSLSSISLNDGLLTIGDQAFYKCYSMSSISIPSSVIQVGEYGFADCSSLTAVVFAENSQLTSVRDHAFGNCYSMSSISIPSSVVEIGSYVFANCSALTAIDFAENSQLTSIGNYFCQAPVLLKRLNLPDSVKKIGSYNLYMVNDVEYIHIPSSINEIPSNAFDLCNKDGSTYCQMDTGSCNVSAIGANAFRNMMHLSAITGNLLVNNSKLTSIGNEAFRYAATNLENSSPIENILSGCPLVSIGDYAFDYCKLLSGQVVIENTIEHIGVSAFTRLRQNITVMFKDKKRADVVSMSNYPWGLNSTGNNKIKYLNDEGTDYIEEVIPKS